MTNELLLMQGYETGRLNMDYSINYSIPDLLLNLDRSIKKIKKMQHYDSYFMLKECVVKASDMIHLLKLEGKGIQNTIFLFDNLDIYKNEYTILTGKMNYLTVEYTRLAQEISNTSNGFRHLLATFEDDNYYSNGQYLKSFDIHQKGYTIIEKIYDDINELNDLSQNGFATTTKANEKNKEIWRAAVESTKHMEFSDEELSSAFNCWNITKKLLLAAGCLLPIPLLMAIVGSKFGVSTLLAGTACIYLIINFMPRKKREAKI